MTREGAKVLCERAAGRGVDRRGWCAPCVLLWPCPCMCGRHLSRGGGGASGRGGEKAAHVGAMWPCAARCQSRALCVVQDHSRQSTLVIKGFPLDPYKLLAHAKPGLPYPRLPTGSEHRQIGRSNLLASDCLLPGGSVQVRRKKRICPCHPSHPVRSLQRRRSPWRLSCPGGHHSKDISERGDVEVHKRARRRER